MAGCEAAKAPLMGCRADHGDGSQNAHAGRVLVCVHVSAKRIDSITVGACYPGVGAPQKPSSGFGSSRSFPLMSRQARRAAFLKQTA